VWHEDLRGEKAEEVSGGDRPRLRRVVAQRQGDGRHGGSLLGEGGGGVRTGASDQ
jgi:hypothetical protein